MVPANHERVPLAEVTSHNQTVRALSSAVVRASESGWVGDGLGVALGIAVAVGVALGSGLAGVASGTGLAVAAGLVVTLGGVGWGECVGWAEAGGGVGLLATMGRRLA